MASHTSELEEVEDKEDNLLVPCTRYYSIWDCPKINKVVSEVDGVVKNGWRCGWCMNPPAVFASFSATKALAHAVRLPLSDVRPCLGVIPKSFLLAYTDLYNRKLEEAKKKSMTDSIDNIQETSSAIRGGNHKKIY